MLLYQLSYDIFLDAFRECMFINVIVVYGPFKNPGVNICVAPRVDSIVFCLGAFMSLIRCFSPLPLAPCTDLCCRNILTPSWFSLLLW